MQAPPDAKMLASSGPASISGVFEAGALKEGQNTGETPTRQAAWRARNPAAYRAHIAVSGALRSGILTKPDACENCGATDKRLDGHHPNYRDRLRIKWLCRACHVRHHARKRKAGAR